MRSRASSFFHQEILKRSAKSQARVTRIYTPNGHIDTPAFVPVATNAALKHVQLPHADAEDMQLLFVNTYHMLVHDSVDVVHNSGSLHDFMNRKRPIITDSGGFQIFSLANRGGSCFESESRPSVPGATMLSESELKYSRKSIGAPGDVKITEQGVKFRSYRNGDMIELTPESSVDAQKKLGADIIIPLDELPAFRVTGAELRRSVARTHRWEQRSLARHLEIESKQAMYGVIHGGMDLELRRESITFLDALPFDGWAVGGSLGRNKTEMLNLISDVAPMLPKWGPRHLLGIGDVDSILRAVPLGYDSFDSCWPSRLGRHGTILTSEGPLDMKKKRFRDDYRKLDGACDGHVAQHYSRAYLHHLFRAGEPVAMSIAALQNIKHTLDVCSALREGILRGEV